MDKYCTYQQLEILFADWRAHVSQALPHSHASPGEYILDYVEIVQHKKQYSIPLVQ
jgi:hypothetical protein